LLRRLELGQVALFVRVARGLVLATFAERLQAGGTHAPLLHEHSDPADVDRAPVARRLPRREPVHVALVVDALANAVDPSEAQRLVDRLRPGDARPARTLLVQAHPQLGRGRVVLVEPGAELLG